MSDKEKREGLKDEVKGKAKEAWGKITNDKLKEVEGKKDQAKGKAKKWMAEVKEELDK